MSLTQRLFSEAFRDMQRAMTAFEQPFLNAAPSLLGRSGSSLLRYPATDMVENKDTYELHAELPGFDKNNIKIELPDSHTLVLKGSLNQQTEVKNDNDATTTSTPGADVPTTAATTERDINAVTTKQQDNNQVGEYKPQYWMQERVSSSFSRAFQFPTPITAENIKASFDNGVLKVVVPKSVQYEPKQITIE